jgi:hypothetical protein
MTDDGGSGWAGVVELVGDAGRRRQRRRDEGDASEQGVHRRDSIHGWLLGDLE